MKKFLIILISVLLVGGAIILHTINLEDKSVLANSRDKCETIYGSNKPIKEKEDKVITSKIKEKIDDYKLRMNDVKEEFKKESLGVGPWKIEHLRDNKLIFTNHKYAVCYSLGKYMDGIYSITDLSDLGLFHVQGSALSEFHVSPNGTYITAANIKYESPNPQNEGDVFIIDCINDKAERISGESIIPSINWACNLSYFALGKQDNNIKFYNKEEGMVEDIEFNKGNLKEVFIADNQDILVNSQKGIYHLCHENNYEARGLNITGEILGFCNNELFWFHNGTIYKQFGEEQEIGEHYKLKGCRDNKAAFEKENKTLIYDLESGENIIFNRIFDHIPIFSPDFKKCIYEEWSNVKILDVDGKEYRVKDDDTINSNVRWLDNNNLIYISQEKDNVKLDGLRIEKYNLTNNESTILFEFPE